MSKTLPLTKVVQNDAYTAPVLPSSVRTKALTNMSRTLVNKEELPKELPPAEVRKATAECQPVLGVSVLYVCPRRASGHAEAWMSLLLSAVNKPVPWTLALACWQ